MATQENAAILTSPYKAHPLFYFLKNKNTIQKDKIISFRNENSTEPVTSLILKPVAKAVAGVDGKAISMPVSKAVLRQGTNVDILFEPEAVAIVGPGGIAHAQSNLEIIYEDYNRYYIAETHPKVTLIPFYGGGKGQSLQIIEKADGSVMTNIIKTPEKKPIPEESINTSDLENPPLPSKQDRDFSSNIRNIHKTALDIIKLQDAAKKNGHLSPEQEKAYNTNLESLNSSAKELAELQEEDDEFSFENREGLAAWFERKKIAQKEKDKKKEEKEEENKQKPDGEKIKEEEEEKEEEESDDGVAIGLPPEDASVAEAKPVGLAVAGEGGVAASKPIATAVVGPGGLAIARPVGTAIAGVAPDQALVPIYAEGYVLGNKPKKHSKNKPASASEYLNRIITKYHQV